MAKGILPNTPGSEVGEFSGPDDKSRRDAMAILARHAAYTAPAVMAILSLTTERATAASGFGGRGGSH